MAKRVVSRGGSGSGAAGGWSLSRDDLVVVAGGGGFIGGHLIGSLLRSGHRRIRAVDVKPVSKWWQRHEGVEEVRADLKGESACVSAARGARVVLNFACDMGGMGFVESNKALCMLSSLINTNLLLASRRWGVERYFFASSVVVYNTQSQVDPGRAPIREEEAYPANPDDGYGWEKLFGERMCRHFREDFGVQTRVARYQPVYGPNGSWDDGRERVPLAICRKVAQAVLTGRHEIEIWGDGTQQRSFMYVDDCVKGTLALVGGEFAGPVNLGPSEIITINELVDAVESVAGVRLERRYKLDAPRGAAMRRISNELWRRTFGWEPSTPLREGLSRTYAWVLEQEKRKAGRRVGSFKGGVGVSSGGVIPRRSPSRRAS